MSRDVVPAPGGHIVFRVTAHLTNKRRSAEPETNLAPLEVVPLISVARKIYDALADHCDYESTECF